MSVEVKLAVHFSHWLNLPQLHSCINRDPTLSQAGESQPGHPHADCWHASHCPVLDPIGPTSPSANCLESVRVAVCSGQDQCSAFDVQHAEHAGFSNSNSYPD